MTNPSSCGRNSAGGEIAMSNYNHVVPARLLCLPQEILGEILKCLLNSHQPKVSEDGRMHNVSGIIGTCRALYHEANLMLCSSSLILFESSEALLGFHALRGASRNSTGYPLSAMQNISIECGAAKHATARVSRTTLRALRLLADEAQSLRQLDLRVSYFYQAASADIPMASKLIKAIGRFKNLSDLSITMGLPPPGPFDCDSAEPDSLKKLFARIRAMETVFRRYTCQLAPKNPIFRDPLDDDRTADAETRLPVARSNNLVTQIKADVLELLCQSKPTGQAVPALTSTVE